MDTEKIESDLPIIKEMVENNLHTEAMARIARITGKAKHELVFNTVAMLQNSQGYIHPTLRTYRDEKFNELMEIIRTQYGEKIGTLLHNAL